MKVINMVEWLEEHRIERTKKQLQLLGLKVSDIKEMLDKMEGKVK